MATWFWSRGACRLIRQAGQSVLLEMPLPNGRRADIFAIGVMTVETLFGERPFGGQTHREILTSAVDQQALDRPPQPAGAARDVGEADEPVRVLFAHDVAVWERAAGPALPRKRRRSQE